MTDVNMMLDGVNALEIIESRRIPEAGFYIAAGLTLLLGICLVFD